MVGQIGSNVSAPSVSGNTTDFVEKVMNSTVKNQTNNGFASEENKQQLSSVNSKEDLQKIVNSMNDFLVASPHTHLKFEFHEKLDEYYVTIIDEKTKEVVREIPPKKMLDMFAAMTEFLGLMVDKKV